MKITNELPDRSRTMESGIVAWLYQKIANGFWTVAMPFMAASNRMDEAAFQAAKRHDGTRRTA